MSYKILCIGNQWRGSDDGSIFRAFSRAGHFINIVDDKFFIPAESNSIVSKIIRRVGLPFFINDYNQVIRRQFQAFTPDWVCVYKGASMSIETLEYMKATGVPVICIYPDVSHFDHGPRIPKCIPKYDFIFHTKTFGIQELKEKYSYTRTSLIQHCADPEIHRKIYVDKVLEQELKTDASFIGSYSKKKENILDILLRDYPECILKIWGSSWERSKSEFIQDAWQKQTVSGDLYAAAINCSSINIAILSESGGNARSGDRVTSRTFHIPGSGGFMMHERTEEFLELFEEDKEAVCFNGEVELVDKIKYYLKNASLRDRIAQKGHEKVKQFHTSDHRISEIIGTLKLEGVI